MKISVVKHHTKATVTDFDTFEEVAKFISQYKPAADGNMWSPAIYKNNYKNNDNFGWVPSVFAIDIDKHLSIEHAKLRCDSLGLRYAILPTQFHRKDKPTKGIEDRYRIIFELSKPIMLVKDFEATWHKVKGMFPELDEACSDQSRGYYFSTSVYAINTEGKLLDPEVGEEKIIVKSSLKKPTGERGKLSSETIAFLLEGKTPVGRNDSTHKAFRNMYSANYSEEEAVRLVCNAPIEFTSGKDGFTHEDVAKMAHRIWSKGDTKYPHIPLDSNEKFKNFILQSDVIIDAEGIEAPIIVNQELLERRKISEDALRKVLQKDYKQYAATNVKVCYRVYDPNNSFITKTEDNGICSYNTYVPPAWQKMHFYGRAEAPQKVDKIPSLIDRFLKHLVNNNKDSYEYLLDWLATAVQSRNLTVLTLIGNEGVGKGLLSDIMQHIVGNSNFNKVRANFFEGRFNSQILNKKLVLLDELKINSTKEYSLFKDLVNAELEIEAKGKDALLCKNYASFILASNELNAVQPPPDDRRFSMIHLNTIKLPETDLAPHIPELRDNAEMAYEFARYLLYRKVTRQMNIPYKDKSKIAQVMDAGLKDWESYFIYEFLEKHLNQTLPLKEVQEHIALNTSLRAPPGRRSIENLAKRFPQYFKLKQDKQGLRHVFIEASPKTESDSLYELLETNH